MASDRTVKVTLVGDADSLNRAFKGAGESASGLGKTLGDVGKAAAGFLAANVIADGVGRLTSGIQDSIAGFKEQQIVSAQTAAVLTSTGSAAGLSAKEIEGMASALKGQSLFADDAIQSGENLLLTFTGIGKDVFPKATETMLDMSQAMGQDLSSTAVQLGKALNNPMEGLTALTRVGVTFTDEQKDQIKVMQESGDIAGAQGVILAELGKEFGGSAKAASDAAGASEKYADKMDDLQDTIGEKLLPIQAKFKEAQVAAISFIVERAIPAITTFAATLSEKLGPTLEQARETAQRFGEFFTSTLLPAIKQFAAVIGDTIGPPLQRFIGFMDEIGGKQALLIGVITAMTIGFGALAVVLAAAAISAIAVAAPFIAVGAAIALLVAGIVLLVQHWDEITARFPVLGTVANEVQVSLTNFANWITGTFVPAIQSVVDYVVEHWDEIRAAIEPVMQAIATVIEFHWNNIKVIFETAFGVIQGLLDVFIGIFTGDWERAWDGIKQIAQSIWDGIVGLIGVAIETIKGFAGIMLEVGTALIQAMWDGIQNLWNGVLWPGLQGLVLGIPGALGDMSMLLWGIGVDIVQGVWTGVQGMWDSFVRYFVGLYNQLPSFVRKAIEAFSPSKVFMRIGEDMVAGSIVGAQNMRDPLLRTFGEIFDAIAPKIRLSNPSLVDALSDMGALMHDAALVNVRDPLLRTFGEIFDKIAPLIRAGGPSLVDAVADMGALLNDFASVAANGMVDAFEGGFNDLKPVLNNVVESTHGTVEQLKTMWADWLSSTHVTQERLAGYWANFNVTLEQLADGMVGFIAEDFSLVIDSFYDLTDGVKAGLAPLTPFLDSVGEAIALWGDGIVAEMTDAFRQALDISSQIANFAQQGGTAATPVLGGTLSGGVYTTPGGATVSGNSSGLVGAPAYAAPSASGAVTQAQMDYINEMNRIQGFAKGTPFVPRDMLAKLHKGERIVPASENRGSGGGGGVTVYGNYQQVFPNVRNGDDFMRTLDWQVP